MHLEAQVCPISDHTMRIEWIKDGQSITASSRIGTIFSFGYVSLNITNLRAEDSGHYVCKAINASGQATSEARIKVQATTDLTASTGIVEQQQYIQQVRQQFSTKEMLCMQTCPYVSIFPRLLYSNSSKVPDQICNALSRSWSLLKRPNSRHP